MEEQKGVSAMDESPDEDDDSLSCPVCLDHFTVEGEKRPVVFGCGHGTCGACSAVCAICPLCRAPVARPAPWNVGMIEALEAAPSDKMVVARMRDSIAKAQKAAYEGFEDLKRTHAQEIARLTEHHTMDMRRMTETHTRNLDDRCREAERRLQEVGNSLEKAQTLLREGHVSDMRQLEKRLRDDSARDVCELVSRIDQLERQLAEAQKPRPHPRVLLDPVGERAKRIQAFDELMEDAHRRPVYPGAMKIRTQGKVL
jgi:hypothetical protein